MLLGGAACQGVHTTVGIIEDLLKNSGYRVYSINDVDARLNDGHCSSILGFGTEKCFQKSDVYDGIIAFDEETIQDHISKLKPNGYILCDSHLAVKDQRVITIDMQDLAEELGNANVVGSIAIGTVLQIYNLEINDLQKIMNPYFLEQFRRINIEAVLLGYEKYKYQLGHQERQLRMLNSWYSDEIAKKYMIASQAG